MSFLDRFFKKQANPTLFHFFYGLVAPKLKERDYVRAYKGWVYACVNAIAEEIATIKLHLMQKKKGGDIEDYDHPALKPLRDVNDFTTSGELFRSTAAFLELSGNHYWYVAKNSSGTPLEIWPLDPTRVTVARSETTYIAGYKFQNDKGEQVPLDPDEIIPFQRFNPLNLYKGMGTVEAAALAIDIDTYSAEWNKNFFYNSALPSGILEFPGTLTEEQFKTMKARWEAQFKGVENAHKFGILEGGIKFNKVSLTQKEMDFLEQRRFSRDEILGIFRVPKTVLGIVEDVNRANAEASEYVFARRVIKPRMQFIVDHLNEFYLPLFGLSYNEYYFKFEDPVPENVELEIKEQQTGLQAGWYTPNEVRAKKGLPPVKNGNSIYIPISLIPLGEAETPEGKSGTAPAQTKAINKDAIVEKRVKFIATEIRKRKEQFHKIFLDQKSDLVNRLKKRKSIKKESANELIRLLFEDWDDWIGILLEPTTDTLNTSIAYAGRQAIQQVGVDIQFDLKNPRVLDWLKDNALKMCKTIADTMKDEVKEKIISAVDEGLGAEDIADRIVEFYNGQAEWRALRVARTEVIGGYAQGSLEGYRQSGLVTGKRWLTAGDDRVEEECEKNERDGIIALNANFSSGHEAPPVHPNCRCVLQPDV